MILNVLTKRLYGRVKLLGKLPDYLDVSENEYSMLYKALEEIYGVPYGNKNGLLFKGINVRIAATVNS